MGASHTFAGKIEVLPECVYNIVSAVHRSGIVHRVAWSVGRSVGRLISAYFFPTQIGLDGVRCRPRAHRVRASAKLDTAKVRCTGDVVLKQVGCECVMSCCWVRGVWLRGATTDGLQMFNCPLEAPATAGVRARPGARTGQHYHRPRISLYRAAFSLLIPTESMRAVSR